MDSLAMQFEPFFDWLVRTTLQASLLICVILLIQSALGRKLGVRWRYCLWLVLLVRMALPWAPQSRVSMYSALPQSLPSAREWARLAEPDHSRSDFAVETARSGTDAKSAPAATAKTVDSAAPAASPKPQSSQTLPPGQSFRMPGISTLLALVWLVGACALGIYIVVTNIRLWRIVQRERPVTDQKILDLLEDCKSQIGTRTILAVIVTGKVNSPALFGFIRPRLLLPKDMIEELDLDELRYIFLHELAHLRRHDIFVGYVVSLLQALHWFNPLVWLGFRRMRADRELASDGLAMSSMLPNETPAYGHTIVHQLERFLQPRRLPSLAGISEDKAQIKRRIAMIAKFKKDKYRWSPAARILIVVLACVSLMNAEQVGTTRQSANDTRTDSSFSDNLIVDSNTGLRFEKVCGITSGGDLVEYKRGLDLSFDGKSFTYGEHVVHGMKDEDLRDLVGFPACRPSWSPDRTMVAFYADGIWLLPLAPETGEPTGPARKLVNGNYWYGPKVEWSPDSEKIVYVSKQDNLLHVLSVKDGADTQIGKKEASRPSWSPDGQWIAHTQHDEGIWLIPANGGESRKLVPVVGRVQPHWSPDGKWIFFRSRGGLHFVRVSDALTAVATLPGKVGGYVSWLPNGKMLFHRDPYEWRDSLRMISSSGGESIKPDAWSAGNPYWTPDGRFVLTWGKHKGRWIYWVVPFAGGDPYPLQLEVPYGYKPGQTRRVQTSLSPSKKKLFFDTHKDPNQPEYWIVPISAKSGTSSGPAVKVFDKAPVERSCWSPDESKLALICRGEIWIAATDGRPPTRFTDASGGNIMRHAWSPDGSAISWITYDQSSSRSILRVHKLSEDKPRDVAETSKEIRHKWSPSGTWIAYEFFPVDLGATWELFITPGSTGESKRLKEITRDEHHKAFKYAWCPDGERLGLLADRTLWIIDIPSGRRQQIGGLLDPVWGRCFDMQWSPDGKTLGLILEAKPESTGPTDDISGNTRLFTVTVPEGKWTDLAGKEGTNYHLSWSPDGKWIAYNSEEWVRTRAEGIVWEVEVDAFLRQAAEKKDVSPETLVTKTRLNSEPTLRRIEVRGRGRVHSQPSFDGKYMSGVDDAGDLVVRDLTTGKERKLTKKESESKDFAHKSLISPDSAKIAYLWFNTEKEDFDLRMVGIDGSNGRLVWGAEEGARAFNMDAWSPDGKHIFGRLMGAAEQLARVSIQNGFVETIQAFDQQSVSQVDVSPDGRYVAYDLAEGKNSNRNIFILDLDRKQETPLVTHPAHDKLLGWTPEGQRVFFASDRNGTWDGWLLRVADGRPRGLPEVVTPRIGAVSPMGFTRSGAFYYRFRHEAWNVYVATLDLDTGAVLSEPRPVRDVGNGGLPAGSTRRQDAELGTSQ